MARIEVNEESKKNILFYSLELLNVYEIKEYMTRACLTDFVSLFEGKRPKILITDENEKLLIYFKKNWITSFYVDSKETQYYWAIGRKYIKKESTEVAID